MVIAFPPTKPRRDFIGFLMQESTLELRVTNENQKLLSLNSEMKPHFILPPCNFSPNLGLGSKPQINIDVCMD